MIQPISTIDLESFYSQLISLKSTKLYNSFTIFKDSDVISSQLQTIINSNLDSSVIQTSIESFVVKIEVN
jgi:hypothetical protein